VKVLLGGPADTGHALGFVLPLRRQQNVDAINQLHVEIVSPEGCMLSANADGL
jgi:hypothetical protein